MAYGTVKVDTIIFDQGGADQNVTVSGIYRAITSGVTVTGTISGAVLIGTATVSGTTVTGTTANFASGVFTTQVSGATVTGTQSSFTSGNFVTLSGATATFTSGVIASGTATNPSLSIVGDGNTGIYSPGADQVAVATNGTGRLFVAADGKVGVGVGSPVTALQVVGTATFGNGVGGRLQATTDSSLGYIDSLNNTSTEWQPLIQRGTEIQFHTNTAGVTPVEKVRITSAGLVGIGTTSPTQLLDISAASSSARIISTTGTNFAFLNFNNTAGNAYVGLENSTGSNFSSGTGAYSLCLAHQGAYPICFATNNLERARIDSSGRLLVGTSTFAQTNTYSTTQKFSAAGSAGDGIQLQGYSADQFNLAIDFSKSRGASVGTNTIVQSNDSLGNLIFNGYDGLAYKIAARIEAFVDGTPGANDMPGRLVFSTTADGAASLTEQMRIKNNGTINFSSVATYADNTAALAGGLVAGDVYRKSDGTLMITY